MPPGNPLGYFQPGLNPWLPQGFGQQPQGMQPRQFGIPPPMPVGTTTGPPYGGRDPRMSTNPSFGGAVESVLDQLMARIFGGKSPDPGISNMPQTPGPWGGSDARMRAVPQLDRSGRPLPPPVPAQAGLPPRAPQQLPPQPSNLPVTQGPWGGPDARMGPMPQFDRAGRPIPQVRPGVGTGLPPGRPTPGGMPVMPPGGPDPRYPMLGGPNARIGPAPPGGGPQMPPDMPAGGVPGQAMRDRLTNQFGMNPDTGLPMATAADWQGPRQPPRPAGPRPGARPPIMAGPPIQGTLGPTATFVPEPGMEEEELAPAPAPAGLPQMTPREPMDLAEGEEPEPVPARESALGTFMKGLADGLPGAIVAFAADRAHSPELAQQYSNMKARQLSEIQSAREDEIRRMENRAEQSRHLASLGMQKLTLRMDIEKNLQGLQQSLGTTDPEAYAKAVQGMMPLYETTGADPELLRQNYPFLAMDVLKNWRTEVLAMYKDVKDEDLDKAMIVNPFTGKKTTLRKALASTYGVDDNGIAVEPSASLPLRDISETDVSGIKRTRTVTDRQARNIIRTEHPDPSYSFMQGQVDPETGMYPLLRGSARRGTMDILKMLPGVQSGPAAELGGIERMGLNIEIDREVRNFMRERNNGVEPPAQDVAAAKQNPAIIEMVRQRLLRQQQGLPQMPR